MSQMLPAVHAAARAAHVVAFTLPDPTTKVTIPIIVVFALLALLAILRKLIGLALVAVIVAGVFVAYQGGAFDHWVDQGKQIVNNEISQR